jgi:anti-sigma B factor antagonist
MAGDEVTMELHGQGGGTSTLAIRGELDMAGAPCLRAFVDQLPGPIGRLVLDLRDLSFLDSTGIGVLLKLERKVREGGGSVEVHGARRSVRRVLEITNLNQLMPLID